MWLGGLLGSVWAALVSALLLVSVLEDRAIGELETQAALLRRQERALTEEIGELLAAERTPAVQPGPFRSTAVELTQPARGPRVAPSAYHEALAPYRGADDARTERPERHEVEAEVHHLTRSTAKLRARRDRLKGRR